MVKIVDWFKFSVVALRPFQWYKNFVVFLALVFSGNLFSLDKLFLSFLAFLSFCFVSSLNYVVNDFVDKKRDLLDPVKRLRPFASGRLGVFSFWFLVLFSGVLGFSLALFLPFSFFVVVLVFFVLSQLYNFGLKNVPLVDVFLVSVNFVLRAVSGAFAVSVWVSPWLVFGVFFLALFLVMNKRLGELVVLKDKAVKHKAVLKFYSPPLVSRLRILFLFLLIVFYGLYCFFCPFRFFFITLPVVFFAVFRYYALCAEPFFAEHPERLFFDLRLLLALFLWLLLVLFSVYLFP